MYFFSLSKALDKGTISRGVYDEITGLVDSFKGDRFPMNLIADRPDGKNILLKTHWDGYFDMNDKEQLKRLKDYVGF